MSAARLMPLIGYFAVAFLAMLAVGTLVPPGRLRSLLIAGWMVLFPTGGWRVFRRS